MNIRDPQALMDKLKQLPPERIAEVEDFVDCLRDRQGERALECAAMRVAVPAFEMVWNYDDDGDYDRLGRNEP